MEATDAGSAAMLALGYAWGHKIATEEIASGETSGEPDGKAAKFALDYSAAWIKYNMDPDANPALPPLPVAYANWAASGSLRTPRPATKRAG